MTTDFFISYASADRAWAEWIAYELERAGYSVVIQAWDFKPGIDFVRAIKAATACEFGARITSGAIATSSTARSVNNSGLPSEWRASMMRFRPSSHPSCRNWSNAALSNGLPWGAAIDAPDKMPTRATFGACASAWNDEMAINIVHTAK